MSEPVLEIKGLVKEYSFGLLKKNKVLAVDGLDISVNQGEIFGFLGPNGAGKTTTLKITMGFLKATSGTIRVFGDDTHKWWVRNRIGFLPENPSVYPYLTGRQALSIIGRMFLLDGKTIERRISELTDQLGLDRELTLPIKKHSKGMSQRIGLAQALINDPDFIILDEPMSGLDPIGRKMFREVILSLKNSGKTVFFSSHILSDVEMLCDRMALLNRGRLALDSTMGEIERIKSDTGKTFEQIFMENVGASK